MKTIHHVIDMDVDPATVWSAVTEQRGLAGWWSTRVQGNGGSVGDRVAFTFSPDDQFGAYNFNWGYYLESLRLLCTRGVGKPYEPAS